MIRGGGARPNKAAQAEAVEEGFDASCQIEDVVLGVAFGAGPEERVARTGESDGDAAGFDDARGGIQSLVTSAATIFVDEDAADLEEGDVVAFVVGVVAEGVDQTGEQAWTE